MSWDPAHADGLTKDECDEKSTQLSCVLPLWVSWPGAQLWAATCATSMLPFTSNTAQGQDVSEM